MYLYILYILIKLTNMLYYHEFMLLFWQGYMIGYCHKRNDEYIFILIELWTNQYVM